MPPALLAPPAVRPATDEAGGLPSPPSRTAPCWSPSSTSSPSPPPPPPSARKLKRPPASGPTPPFLRSSPARAPSPDPDSPPTPDAVSPPRAAPVLDLAPLDFIPVPGSSPESPPLPVPGSASESPWFASAPDSPSSRFAPAADSAPPSFISLPNATPTRPWASLPSEQASSAAPRPPEPLPELCPEQQNLVDLIAAGGNVFYTGSAGCGKSTVLKAALRRLFDMGRTVHTLAPTGRAALQVHGTTTWSYMGWTPDHQKLSIDELKRLSFRHHVKKRLQNTDVLIIDEISMIENHHLERIKICMKEVRRWKQDDVAAFGGVQVVVTGDFCQLPPVKPFQHCITCGQEMAMDEYQIEFNCPDNHGPFREHQKWAFMSDAWDE